MDTGQIAAQKCSRVKPEAREYYAACDAIGVGKQAVEAAFPDALVTTDLPESPLLDLVDAKDRHVVMTALVAQADAIVTFNMKDFAAPHLSETLQIEVIHPDDFVMDLVDLNEKRAVAAFRELRTRKKNPPIERVELIQRLRDGGLVQTSLWLSASDVGELI